MKEFKFETADKGNYERVINVLCEKGIKYKGRMDDWNCKFEIVYCYDKEITINKYNELIIGGIKYVCSLKNLC